MTWLSRLVLTAAVVEGAVAVAGLLVAGVTGLIAALIGSTIAMGAQLTAILVLRPGMMAPGREFLKRWTGGIAMRGISFVIVAAVMILTRNVLPPVWIAAGYLAQMLTLLFAETVFLK